LNGKHTAPDVYVPEMEQVSCAPIL